LKKIVIDTLKIIIPLAFGLFLIWYVYDLLSEEEKEQLFTSLGKANYLWIIASVFFGIVSHISRAYRWKYLLDPLGFKPKFLNSFFSVMIGYTVNLMLPRVGEVTRCGVLSKYENIPFNKAFGTVIAERIADITILSILTLTVIFSQMDKLRAMILSWLPEGEGKTQLLNFLGISGLVLTIAMIGMYFIFKRSSNELVGKIKSLLLGFIEGIKSILKMESRVKFILHTLFIWLMYIIMFYICFFSLPETSNVPLIGVLAAFVMGGLSIIFIQGGIGVYPAAVMEILFLYGVGRPSGLALGWIIWISQTAMILLLGTVSMLLMPRYNKKLKNNG